MDIEYRKNDRRDRIARNRKCQHRDQRTADAGVVGGLTRHDSFDRAFSERNLRIFHEAFCLIIGDKGCHRSAGSRKSSD